MLYTVELYFKNGAQMTLVMDEADVKRLKKYWANRHTDPRNLWCGVSDVSDGYGFATDDIMAYRVVSE